MSRSQAHIKLGQAVIALIATFTTSFATAQIPKEAVDAAVKGPMRTLMLTASSDHDYAHRTQITPAKITKSGNTVVAEGRLQNIVKFDDDGFMSYRITCEGKKTPKIEIFDVKEAKDVSRRLKKALKVGKVLKDVVPKIVEAFSKEDSDSESFDMQLVADGDPAAAKEIAEFDEKDWKVPCVALISAIAARLQASQ
jgi:hypothetical protein